jgi:hypothetical protein
MSKWFRWYEGTTEDGKFRVTARYAGVTVRDVIALWAFILEDASHDDHRGICYRNADFMSAILDFEDGVVERILVALDSAGLISRGNGELFITNWDKRQYESDKSDATAAERMRRYRARKSGKTEDNDALRQRYGDVTPTIRPDTDTETDSTNLKVSSARKRAHRLPTDWKLPDDYRQAARDKGLSDEEINRQAEKMHNWSLSSKNGVKLDWYRTWLNWISDAPTGQPCAVAKPKERDLRSVPDNLLSADDYWKKRKQQREWA